MMLRFLGYMAAFSLGALLAGFAVFSSSNEDLPHFVQIALLPFAVIVSFVGGYFVGKAVVCLHHAQINYLKKELNPELKNDG